MPTRISHDLRSPLGALPPRTAFSPPASSSTNSSAPSHTHAQLSAPPPHPGEPTSTSKSDDAAHRRRLVVPSSERARQRITRGAGAGGLGLKLERAGVELWGYQLYAVERWIIERNPKSETIVNYTGDTAGDKILVDIYCPFRSLPSAEQEAEITRALKELFTDGARDKQTDLGRLSVTSISSFRSDLVIVQLPRGSIDDVLDSLIVNINLRRLGCAGREGLQVDPPGPVQREKYLSTFHLPPGPPPPPPAQPSSPGPSNPAQPTSYDLYFQTAVLELIRLVKIALSLFGMYDAATVEGAARPDGLLCQYTVDAIRRWVATVGEPKLGIELASGLLEVAIVAGLLSMIATVKYKLGLLDEKVPADPFVDTESFRLALLEFQRDLRTGPSAPPAPTTYLTPTLLSQVHHAHARLGGRSDRYNVRRGLHRHMPSTLGGGASSASALAAANATIRVDDFVAQCRAGGGAFAGIDSLRYLWDEGGWDRRLRHREKARKRGEREDAAPLGSGSVEEDRDGGGPGLERFVKSVGEKTRERGQAIVEGVTGLIDRGSRAGNKLDWTAGPFAPRESNERRSGTGTSQGSKDGPPLLFVSSTRDSQDPRAFGSSDIESEGPLDGPFSVPLSPSSSVSNLSQGDPPTAAHRLPSSASFRAALHAGVRLDKLFDSLARPSPHAPLSAQPNRVFFTAPVLRRSNSLVAGKGDVRLGVRDVGVERDAQGRATRPVIVVKVTRPSPATSMSPLPDAGDAQEGEEGEPALRERRYSFSDAATTQRNPHLSAKRMKTDLDLYEGLWKLRERERDLARYSMLLEELNNAQGEAIASLRTELAKRQAKLSALRARGEALTTQANDLLSTTVPALATSNERLSFKLDDLPNTLDSFTHFFYTVLEKARYVGLALPSVEQCAGGAWPKDQQLGEGDEVGVGQTGKVGPPRGEQADNFVRRLEDWKDAGRSWGARWGLVKPEGEGRAGGS